MSPLSYFDYFYGVLNNYKYGRMKIGFTLVKWSRMKIRR